MDDFFSQLSCKCHLEKVASVGVQGCKPDVRAVVAQDHNYFDLPSTRLQGELDRRSDTISEGHPLCPCGSAYRRGYGLSTCGL